MTACDTLHRPAYRALRLLSVAAIGMSSLAVAHPGTHDAAQGPVPAEQRAQADTATPVGTVTAFHAALANGNTTAALNLLAEDVMIFESGAVESSRAEYASHHLHADVAFSAAVPRTLVSRTQAEYVDTAWVMSVEAVIGRFRDRAINSRSVETMALRRTEDGWRIAHIHWSSADIPAN